MGMWTSASFVNTTDVAAIVEAVDLLLQAQGYVAVENPAELGEPSRTEHAAFAARASEKGWSIIKAFPADLLAEQVTGGLQPRLALISQLLQVDAVHAGVYDDSASILIEIQADGTLCSQGGTYTDDGVYSEVWKELDERVAPESREPPFWMHTPPESMWNDGPPPDERFMLHKHLNQSVGPLPIGGPECMDTISRGLTGLGEDVWYEAAQIGETERPDGVFEVQYGGFGWVPVGLPGWSGKCYRRKR